MTDLRVCPGSAAFPAARTLQKTAKQVQASMLRKLFLLLLVFVGGRVAFAQVPIPDTPAGHALTAWFDAFNSGDQARIDAYIKNYDPRATSDFFHNFRAQTGGFDLLSIDKSEPLQIKFRVKEKASTTVAIGNLILTSAEPHKVENFGLRAIPPGGVVEDVKLDAAARKRVIDGIADDITEYYVYPEIGQKMIDAVRAHLKAGDYDNIIDGDSFASKLTTDLLDVSHDKHLHVNFSPVKLPPDPPDGGGPTPAQIADFRKDMEHDNCGFRKVEILPGNIGYLKFDMFADADICGPTLVSAMAFLAHVDAIIYDMRENGGGDPKMVALACTYLFDKPTHLNDLYNRKEDKTEQYWTLPYVPGNRLPNIPAYVLTASRTFSGAEEFTNDLKTQKRATIVGEVTGGGAHPVSGHRIDDHFTIGVPFARAINPITKTDWEGTGVTPDVPVKAADALDTAEKLATERIQSANGSKPKMELK
ncbi:MAG: S41 family peptidase [Terracidiphilus sp.]